MPKTARGIYHDLRESTYTTSNNGVVLFFSSRLYRDKFLKEHKEFRDKQMGKLRDLHPHFYKYYKDRLYLYYDILCYEEIEKRGFRVKYKGDEFTCQDFLKFALGKTINTNIDDWLKTPEQK